MNCIFIGVVICAPMINMEQKKWSDSLLSAAALFAHTRLASPALVCIVTNERKFFSWVASEWKLSLTSL